jgi:hypothetical protein
MFEEGRKKCSDTREEEERKVLEGVAVSTLSAVYMTGTVRASVNTREAKPQRNDGY